MSRATRRTRSCCIVQLGRFGDLLLILPAAKMLADAGVKVDIAVTAEFAPLIEGVSYAEPVIRHSHYMDPVGAMEGLVGRYDDLRCTRLRGRPADPLDSYARDAWRAGGFDLEAFDREPLIIDRRDRDREQALIDRHIDPADGRPIMLVALAGHSAPFPHAGNLRRYLYADHDERWQIIDLDQVQAERLHDLLGLYDKALASGGMLIASDSAPLHLSYANRLPVAALTSDGWVGSPARDHWRTRIPYSRAAADLDELDRAIAARLQEPHHAAV